MKKNACFAREKQFSDFQNLEELKFIKLNLMTRRADLGSI